MASLIAKKQEEWNAQKLRELLLLPENKKCFDCPTKSPFFVNISIQTFICTRCSGLVREVGHRVKSISASKFSGPEVVALQHGGNEVAKSIWLSKYHTNTPEPETDADVRLFMRQKYYEQKWLDRNKAVAHSEKVKKILTDMFAEDGSRKTTRAQMSPPVAKQQTAEVRPVMTHTQSWVDDNVPIGLISSIKSKDTEKANNLLFDNHVVVSSPIQPLPSPSQSSNNKDFILPPPTSSTSSNLLKSNVPNVKMQTQTNSDIFSELVDLNPVKLVKSPTYVGGILQPNSPSSPSSTKTLSPIMSPSLTQYNEQTNVKKSIDLDPYAALRNLSLSNKPSMNQNNMNINTSLANGNNDASIFGDFVKSPTSPSFNNNNNNNNRKSFNNNNALFNDLDPLYNKHT